MLLLLALACESPQEITVTLTVEPSAQAPWADALPAEVVLVFEPAEATGNDFDKAWSFGALCEVSETDDAVFSGYLQDTGCAQEIPVRALLIDGTATATCGEKLVPLAEKPEGELVTATAWSDVEETCTRMVSDTLDLRLSG